MFCPTRHCSCLPRSQGHELSRVQTSIPSVRVDCHSYVGDKRPSMSSSCCGVSQYYGEVHAPHDTPASHYCFRDLTGLHDSRPIPGSACSLYFCSASNKADQPRDRRNRHSRETPWKHSQRPSIPDESHRKDGRPNLDAQASSTDSKATESSSRIG
jgi:hypothetical protein